MKKLTVITSAFILVFCTVASRGANLDRISAATGVSAQTLQAERASTGLGWGGIEKAHLLANASGQSFDNVVALHQSGQGWGKIAHDNGLNLGRLVSDANRSSQATAHAQNLSSVHGKQTTTVHGRSATTVRTKNGTAVRGRSATNIGKAHRPGTSATPSVSHRS